MMESLKTNVNYDSHDGLFILSVFQLDSVNNLFILIKTS